MITWFSSFSNIALLRKLTRSFNFYTPPPHSRKTQSCHSVKAYWLMNGSDSPVQRLPSQNIITTSSGNIGSGFLVEKKWSYFYEWLFMQELPDRKYLRICNNYVGVLSAFVSQGRKTPCTTSN